MEVNILLLALAIVVILLLIYYPYIKTMYAAPAMLPDADAVTKTTVVKERMENDPKANSDQTYQPDESDTLRALGYTGNLPWDEVIQVTELDPATFANQAEFVKDVRRFSSGANFTSVTDDNTNLAFVNFVGLRRPEHVKIGADARQQPDIDESVLQRNQVFRWNSTS